MSQSRRVVANTSEISIMTEKLILVQDWQAKGAPSVQEWACGIGRVAAFEKMSYKKFSMVYLYG